MNYILTSFSWAGRSAKTRKMKVKVIESSNEHAAQVAAIYAKNAARAIAAGTMKMTYPELGIIDAHDALKTFLIRRGDRLLYEMRASFGYALVDITS